MNESGHEYERRGMLLACRLCGHIRSMDRAGACDGGAQQRREAECTGHVRSEPTALTGAFTCTKCGMQMGGYAVTSGRMYDDFQRSLPR